MHNNCIADKRVFRDLYLNYIYHLVTRRFIGGLRRTPPLTSIIFSRGHIKKTSAPI